MEDIGTFKRYENGYFIFSLKDGELITFDEIDRRVHQKFNLKSSEWIGSTFKITYTEIIEDLDDEDFIVLKITNLELKK